MFGKCKVCQEKDARIEDLKDQIEGLRKLVFAPDTAKNIPAGQMEADRILSGADEVIQVRQEDIVEGQIKSGEDFSEIDKVMSERDRILSGTY